MLKNANWMICAQLNLNSIRSKFDQLVNTINNNIDIVMLSETKVDPPFSIVQFHIQVFSEHYRFHRNHSNNGILLCISESIPSKPILNKIKIKRSFVEINWRNKSWVLCYSYNPKKSLISEHLKKIGKNLKIFSSNYAATWSTFKSKKIHPQKRSFCFSKKNFLVPKNLKTLLVFLVFSVL